MKKTKEEKFHSFYCAFKCITLQQTCSVSLQQCPIYIYISIKLAMFYCIMTSNDM